MKSETEGEHKVRIIGVPRSGTNLAKYLIESNTDIRCYFNDGWWKHAIVPPLMGPHGGMPPESPTVIMFREPLRQIVSFFRFALKGRTAIVGATEFRAFASSPITMQPPGQQIEYQFATPVEYWIQFHHAAVQWKNARKRFIELNELQSDPSIIAVACKQLLPQASFKAAPLLPVQYCGRNGDEHVSEAWSFESDSTVEFENRQADAIISGLSAGDIDAIVPSRATALYRYLREAATAP